MSCRLRVCYTVCERKPSRSSHQWLTANKTTFQILNELSVHYIPFAFINVHDISAVFQCLLFLHTCPAVNHGNRAILDYFNIFYIFAHSECISECSAILYILE